MGCVEQQSTGAGRHRCPQSLGVKTIIGWFQGDSDRVVPREQSDSIVASLKARGVTHEYHVYEGEGHGWRKAETIDHFWKTVDRFLREHVLFA